MDEYDVEKFTYNAVPLDPSLDSIRLLTLLPAQDGAIRCRLTTVTFAQRPKYEALSYRWGSTSPHHSRMILVNGKSLLVGKNLFQALKFLRCGNEAVQKILWVDAVCINQSDLGERNSQVAMMSWIYSRAQRVLVWLGLPPKKDMSLKEGPNAMMWLARSEYWKRVWIIQEIGLARRIMICFATQTMEWDLFIKQVSSMEASGDCLPLQLHKQLDGKYRNEHDLQELVEFHADKLCKDPRDHIYGFVGLANDCQDGFPMDYEKPLYEVWKDVMAFQSSKNGHSAHDIMHFGKKVYDLLGGNAMVSPKEFNSDPFFGAVRDSKELARIMNPSLDSASYESEKASPSTRVETAIKIRARVTGQIVHIGPYYEEAISSYKKVAKWKASINRWLPEDKRPSAREASELFLEVLENVEDKDLRVVSGVSRDISWNVARIEQSIHDFHFKSAPLGLDTGADPNELTSTNGNQFHGMARLFLIGGIRSLYSVEESCPGAMGLLPHGAQVGDYICQVHGLKKAVIVRMTSNAERLNPHFIPMDTEASFRIIGTAGLAQDCTRARASRNNDASPKFAEADFDYLDERDAFELLVDMPFSYSLLE